MEIPLVFRDRPDGALVGRLPLAYRLATGIVFAITAIALLPGQLAPGIAGWAVLALTALAALYEERWTIDPSAGLIVHRVGLVFLARRSSILLADVASVRVAPFVKGTVPGSQDEAAENAAALAGGRADDLGRKRAVFKKPYLCILIETVDGSRYFVDASTVRGSAGLRARAARIAKACGKELAEG